jgi:hypothetical protein
MMHDEKAALFIEKVVTTKTRREILERFGWDKSQDSDVFIKKLMAEWLWRSGVREVW